MQIHEQLKELESFIELLAMEVEMVGIQGKKVILTFDSEGGAEDFYKHFSKD